MAEAAHPRPAAPGRVGLWLFAALLSLYLGTAGGELFTSDGAAMFRTTEALVRRGTLAVDLDEGLPQIETGWDGRAYSRYDLGQPVLAIPFYLAGVALGAILPYGEPHVVAYLALTTLPQFATALTGLVFYHLCLTLYADRRAAALLTLLWGTGTLAWPYSKFYFAEALLTLFLVLACWLLIRAEGRRGPWPMGLAGLALGGAIIVRAWAAIFTLPFGIYLLVSAAQDERLSWGAVWGALRRGAPLAVGMIPALIVFLWHNVVRYHHPLLTGYQGQGFTSPFYIGLYGMLFSSGRSVFLYAPPTLVGLLSLRRFGERFPAVRALIIGAFATVVIFFSPWWGWHGGWSWGPRYLVTVMPLLVLPIGIRLISPTRRFLIALGVVWLIALLVSIAGVGVDFNEYFIAVFRGDYAVEQRLWFYPRESPLIVHWEYILSGHPLALVGHRLSSFGLPALVDWVTYPGMALVFGLSLTRVASLCLPRLTRR
jgi:hypothetical protein